MFYGPDSDNRPSSKYGPPDSFSLPIHDQQYLLHLSINGKAAIRWYNYCHTRIFLKCIRITLHTCRTDAGSCPSQGQLIASSAPTAQVNILQYVNAEQTKPATPHVAVVLWDETRVAGPRNHVLPPTPEAQVRHRKRCRTARIFLSHAIHIQSENKVRIIFNSSHRFEKIDMKGTRGLPFTP